jgi:Spy/CpxP family protein refolding chaperone
VTIRKFAPHVTATWILLAGALFAGLSLQSSGGLSAFGRQTAAKPQTAGSQTPPPGGRMAAPPAPAGQGAPQAGGQGRGRPTSFRSWAWWNDDDIKKQLGLTEAVVRRIDSMYQARQKELSPLVAELSRTDDEIDALVKERKISPDALDLKVVNREALRSKLNESRTMMLYKFYLLLTPEQYNKLRDVFDQHVRGGRGGGPK